MPCSLSTMSACYDSINVIGINLWCLTQVRLLRSTVLSWFIIMFLVMHSPLLLCLSSIAFKINNGFQCFVWQIVLKHLLRLRIVNFWSFSIGSSDLSVSMTSPIGFIGVFIIWTSIGLLLVMPGTAIVKVRIIHWSNVSWNFFKS